MATLFAQPYSLDATDKGFYFESMDEYEEKAEGLTDRFGLAVEEFEIQFIDGEEIDGELFGALGVTQATIERYYEAVETLEDYDKIKIVIAVNECGYVYEETSRPDDFEVDIYEVDTLKELAYQFVEEGLYGEIPESLRFYIDYNAIARDLDVEYSETKIAGRRYVYRCG